MQQWVETLGTNSYILKRKQWWSLPMSAFYGTQCLNKTVSWNFRDRQLHLWKRKHWNLPLSALWGTQCPNIPVGCNYTKLSFFYYLLLSTIFVVTYIPIDAKYTEGYQLVPFINMKKKHFYATKAVISNYNFGHS